MDQIYAYIQKQLAICEPGDSQLQILRQMKISNDEKIKYYLSMQGWSGAIQPKGLEFLKLCEQFGCYIFPAARTLWKQFGGLSIHSRFHFDSTEFEGLFIGNDSFDIDDVIELELLELKKNELLIPVGVDTLWGTYNGYRTVYWGESGKVYVTNEGFIYTIAQDMFSYLGSSDRT